LKPIVFPFPMPITSQNAQRLAPHRQGHGDVGLETKLSYDAEQFFVLDRPHEHFVCDLRHHLSLAGAENVPHASSCGGV
jgi:hypothetical protein